MLLVALRWYVLVASRWDGAPPARVTLTDYWRGLAAGLLMPGSLGHDAYRTMRLSAWGLRVRASLTRLLLEKLLSISACIALAGVASWGLRGSSLLASLAPGTGVLAGLLLAALIAVQRPPRFVAGWVNRWLTRLAGESSQPAGQGRRAAAAPRWPSVAAIAGAMVLSLCAVMFSALQAQCSFLALGVAVDWSVTLLAAPILLVALALPLSVGGFGVREVVHIVVYGAFGVAPEQALMVSVFGLAGLVLNWLVGTVAWVVPEAVAPKASAAPTATSPD